MEDNKKAAIEMVFFCNVGFTQCDFFERRDGGNTECKHNTGYSGCENKEAWASFLAEFMNKILEISEELE